MDPIHAQRKEAMNNNWIKLSDRLPPLERSVLVFSPSSSGRDIEVKVLHERIGHMSDTGAEVKSLAWYPGGRDIACTTHWMELPEGPSEAPRTGYVWTGESVILEDEDGAPCVDLNLHPQDAVPRCPVRVRYRVEEIIE
jgi:hypothetical protein